jgi:hypothetical protein
MYSHYTSLLYGVAAVCGQGTWVCPTFTALMGLSTLTQGKAREDYRGKAIVTEATHSLEFYALARSLFEYTNTPFNSLSFLYLISLLTTLYTYQKTDRPGIPGRVAYMGVHISSTLGIIFQIYNI